MGEGEYVVLIDGEAHRFSHWDDIPESFDNLVKFLPEIPPGPHTEDQHKAIEQLPAIFMRFFQREIKKCLP